MNFQEYCVLLSVYHKDNPVWLRESFDCMLGQTVPPSQFVLVEDGPIPEALEEVISEYSSNYPKLFKIVKLEKNLGLGLALMNGILNCDYELIVRTDSDDISDKTRVEKQLIALSTDPSLDLIGTNVKEFIDSPEDPVCYVDLPESHSSIVKFSKKRNPFRHSAVLFKKQAVLKAGNYRDYYLFEDYDLWVRMIETGSKCLNIQEPLVAVRVNKDFYKRRGGLRYLKSIRRFKRELLSKKYINFWQYLRTYIPHLIVCIMPNFMRDFIYKKFLRRKGKKK